VRQARNLSHRFACRHALADRDVRVLKVGEKVPATGIATHKDKFRPVTAEPPTVDWRKGIRGADRFNHAILRRAHGRSAARAEVDSRV
jgi:hypothetical protein